jgi:predicted MFS family arabinose efflux permease
VSFLASSALIATIDGDFAPRRAGGAGGAPTTLLAEIGEGLRWLVGRRVLLGLAVLVALMNLSMMAGESVMVLFAQEALGLGNVGYGLLLTGFAAGGVLGNALASRLGRMVGTGTLLVAIALLAAAGWLLFGLSSNRWAASALLVAISTALSIFNVIGVSLRQGIVPDRLVGRVVAAYRTVGYGAIPAGALLGGVLGRTLGLRAPYLAGAAVIAAAALLALPVINDRAVQAAREDATADPMTAAGEAS